MNKLQRKIYYVGTTAAALSLLCISLNPSMVPAFYDKARSFGSDLREDFFEGGRKSNREATPTTQPDYSKESTIIIHDRDEGKLMVDNAWDLEKQLYLLGPKYRKEVKNC